MSRAPSVDARRVASYLRGHGVPVAGEVRTRLITGGRSNLTYELVDDDAGRWVLRMPPTAGRAERSHDIAREHSILHALASSSVPVPRVVALCLDDEILGAPFYVAEFIDGAVLATRRDGQDLTPNARAVASRSIVDALAAIHAVDVAEIGLGEIGRGVGYLDRQLRRWSGQASRLGSLSGRLLLEVHHALAADVPETQRTCMVHGDYKFANVIVDDDTGGIRAILDWELATIGDPLIDLGNLLAMWPEPGEHPLFESPTSNDGFLVRGEITDRYSLATGLDVSRATWYHAFASWRIACLLTGVVERYRGGAMAKDDFDIDAGAKLVDDLARAALSLIREQPTAPAQPAR